MYNYYDLISPSLLFKNDKEVKNFLEEECTVEDLQCFLQACEKEELYEYCSIIVKKINEKLQRNT